MMSGRRSQLNLYLPAIEAYEAFTVKRPAHARAPQMPIEPARPGDQNGLSTQVPWCSFGLNLPEHKRPSRRFKLTLKPFH